MAASRIVLFGYRGSGKTSIGRVLADQLWKTYADVDHVTRQRFENRTIARIWEQDGEPAWRAAEARVTGELMTRPDHVIGLGGGTLMEPEARRAVVEAPDTLRIYLACQPEVLLARINADPDTASSRPNLTDTGGAGVTSGRAGETSGGTKKTSGSAGGTSGGTSGGGGGMDEIETVLAQRDPVYRAVAEVVFDVSFVGIDEAARYLMSHHL